MKKIIVGILIICMILLSGCIDNDNSKSELTIYDSWVSVVETFTPNDSLVIETKNKILGNDSDGFLTSTDVTKFQEWVNKNINYLDRDVLYFPNETLTYLECDCSEYTTLMYSFLSAENVNSSADIYVVYVVFYDGYAYTHHGAVLVVFEDYLFLSDSTYQDRWEDISNTFYPVDNISTIINSILRYSNLEEYNIWAVFSECCFNSFDDNEEFYGWCEYQLDKNLVMW